jgi:hypothetical protein
MSDVQCLNVNITWFHISMSYICNMREVKVVGSRDLEKWVKRMCVFTTHSPEYEYMYIAGMVGLCLCRLLARIRNGACVGIGGPCRC